MKPSRTIAGRITGYTRHGLEQAIAREGVGVLPRAILDALRELERIVPQPKGLNPDDEPKEYGIQLDLLASSILLREHDTPSVSLNSARKK